MSALLFRLRLQRIILPYIKNAKANLMKNILPVLFIFFFLQAQAQAPQKINYQGVLRDVSGNILANQNICVQSTITDVTSTANYYQETFNITTNQFGLFNIQLGAGLAPTGIYLSNVNWGSVTPYHKVEVKIGCTGNYVLMGSSQLVSVPYALNALNATTAASVTGYPADTIGTFAHGGVVFYVDETGHHGLVCALTDQSTSVAWNNTGVLNSFLGIDGDGQGAGEMNTTLIIANQSPYNGAGNYAAKVCDRYTSPGDIYANSYGDWYLPSKWEFNNLLISTTNNSFNDALIANGGTAITYIPNGAYWTSTEIDADNAYANSLSGPYLNSFVPTNKNTELLYVRAIRKF
jgi:hypothetical protein